MRQVSCLNAPSKRRAMSKPSPSPFFALAGGALIALAVGAPARAEWVIDANGAFVHDSNLTRAASDDAIRADSSIAAMSSLGYVFVPAAGTVAVVDANVSGERYHRYRGLDHVAIGLNGFVRHKLGMGADVPYVIASLAIARDNYRDDLRDSDRIDGFVEAGRRFDPTFDAALGAGFDRRRQRYDAALVPGISGNVFDLDGRSAWVRASYALNDDLELGARVEVRRGDVESTAHRGLAIFTASDAVAEDPAFGESELYAYRLRGTTWSAGLTLSWALSPHASLTGGYTDERTSAAEGLDYRSRVARLTFSYRL